MNFLKPYFLFLIAIFLCGNYFSQDKTLDSLKLALKNAKHDTTRCNILDAMIEAESDDAIWPKYNEELKRLAEKKLSENTYSAIAKIYKKHLAASLNNLGFVYNNRGDIAKALEYFGKSLKIREETVDKQGIAQSLNNIGAIYLNQGEISKALEYFGRSLKLREGIGDKQGIALSLNNIGSIYQNQGVIAKALEYYGRSLKILEETGHKQGIAYCLNNIGYIYDTQGASSSEAKAKEKLFAKALEYYRRGLNVREEIGDKKGIAQSLNYIGDIHFKQKNYSKALDAGTKSFLVSKELGYPENIQRAAQVLSDIYQKINQPAKALQMYKLYIQMRDSVVNTENKKKSIQQQFKYEYEKKAAADSVVFAKEREIKNIEIEKQKAELKAKRNAQYFMFGGLVLVIVFAGFMYNRFRVTQKQKGVIEEQKSVVEEQKNLVEVKQKEILDSIHYAKCIQTALLPSEQYVHKTMERLMK